MLPRLILDGLSAPELEIAIEDVQEWKYAEIRFAQKQGIVPGVGQHDEVANDLKETEVPFVHMRDIVVKEAQLRIWLGDVHRWFIANIGGSKIPELKRFTAGRNVLLPLSTETVFVLYDRFVITEIPPVFFHEPLLELFSREVSDPLMVPTAIYVAVELIEVRRRSGAQDVLQLFAARLCQGFIRPDCLGHGGFLSDHPDCVLNGFVPLAGAPLLHLHL